MKRILVTGCQGYLGSVLTRVLSQKGYECTGFDPGFFSDALLGPASDPKIARTDARDISEEEFDNVFAVVHLAGISNDPMNNLEPESVYDPTRLYTKRIAEICKKKGVKFIFASSCSVYGVGHDGLVDEESQVNPQTHYSLNKMQIEEDLAALSSKEFAPVALRFATVFGLSPRPRFDVVVNMLVGMAVASGRVVLNSDGSAWRPHLHIDDACEAIAAAIELERESEELLVVNVGLDQNNMQIIDVANIVCEIVDNCSLEFLNLNPELDKDGLVRDRKISRDVDVRTYKVSFRKLNALMPNLNLRWDVRSGVENMVKQLNDLDFSEEEFKRRDFYRLQKLEDLLTAGRLSSNLRWVT